MLLTKRLRDELSDPCARLNLSVVHQNTGQKAEPKSSLVALMQGAPETEVARRKKAVAAGRRIAAIPRRNLVLPDGWVPTDNLPNASAVGHINTDDWMITGLFADSGLAVGRGTSSLSVESGRRRPAHRCQHLIQAGAVTGQERRCHPQHRWHGPGPQ